MGLDEKLFRIGYKAIESILRRRRENPEEEASKVLLSDVADRLTLIAGIWTGEKIEIREAETVGGYVGTTVLLPTQVALSLEPELNWQAYLYRLVFSLCQRELGIAMPAGRELSPEEQLLLTALAVPAVEARMDETLPGARDLRARVSELALRKRPEPGALEALTQVRLGRKLAEIHEVLRPEEREWLTQALSARLSDADSLLKKLRRLPAPARKRAPVGVVLWGQVMNERPENSGAQAGKSSEIPTAAGLASGTGKKAKAKERVEEVKLDENPLGDNPVVHSFEKLHTADEYKGGQKSRDAEDSLEEHAEALEELDLRKIVRTRDRAQSIYKADVMMEVGVGDLEESAPAVSEYSYDEWDEKRRSYKKNWCSLFMEQREGTLEEKDVHAYVQRALTKYRRQSDELKRMFERLEQVRRWRNRQPDGPEIDLDAVIDRYATLKSGHSPSESLYLSRRRQERDIATLILLDASLSTDSWVQDRRVLDVAKESIIVLGNVASKLRDRVAVSAFYSNTRRDCRYVELKRFDESWASGERRLVGLQPAGYTRIGPALRHSIFLLSKVPAKKKLLLLISDGKPTDFDRYEGRYGIADIRQAIREGAQRSIGVKALAIDAQAKFYLPRMFGPGNFSILPRPELLAESLGFLYAQACPG